MAAQSAQYDVSIMSAAEKIKLAAAGLDPDEQYELFRWWVESDSFKQRQLSAPKQDIAIGIVQLARPVKYAVNHSMVASPPSSEQANTYST